MIKSLFKSMIRLKAIEFKNRIIYNNEKLDIAIIEIQEKDEIKNFLILDDENQDFKISGKTIYILEYLDTNEPSVAYGILKDLDNSSFTHSCNTTFGASGSPIMNLETNKVIGIHIGCSHIHN